MDLAAWKGRGNDVQSVEMPLQVVLDTRTLELKVTAPPGSKVPTWTPPAEILPPIPPLAELIPPEYPRPLSIQGVGPFMPLAELLRCDLLGRPRSGPLQMGPLEDLQMDGTGLRIDPRHANRWPLS
jgi:hypothetical protein